MKYLTQNEDEATLRKYKQHQELSKAVLRTENEREELVESQLIKTKHGETLPAAQLERLVVLNQTISELEDKLMKESQ